jgi:ACS family hexuronate transporter-like MFS transporter
MRDRYRWLIAGLLVLATIINYVDRQVLAILSSSLEFQRITGFGPVEYGYANALFNAAYALALPLTGLLADRLGTRLGFLLVMGLWSAADMAHALARGPASFFAARFALGLGEAGCFPTGVKAIAEWFPQRERALATGAFNAGASVGAILAPLTIPLIYAHLGWRWAFVLTGLVGLVWMVAWAALAGPPRGHRRVSAAELRHIEGDTAARPSPAIGWAALLRRRETWAIVAGKGLADPIWFFYLFWMPRLFATRFDVRIGTIGLPLALIYLMSDVGAIGGGWWAGHLIARGQGVRRARRTVMLVAALAALPALAGAQVREAWILVLLVGLATAAHQAWSSNLFALAADLFPPGAVGRVVGLAGAAGSLGAMVINGITGHVVARTGGYQPLFVWAALAYLVAWGLVQLLIRGSPRPDAAFRP